MIKNLKILRSGYDCIYYANQPIHNEKCFNTHHLNFSEDKKHELDCLRLPLIHTKHTHTYEYLPLFEPAHKNVFLIIYKTINNNKTFH